MRAPRPDTRDALLIGALHLALAVHAWAVLGVTIVHDYGPRPWDWFWQNIPADLLSQSALESLWYLHAQPPLWNALGAVLLKLFGDGQLIALQGLHILLGAATASLSGLVTSRLTGRRRWGAAVGLLVALHPALLLYEAYALYTLSVAFALVLAAFLLSEAGARRSPGFAVAFAATLSALILTRSLFHPVLWLFAAPLALVAGGRPSRATGLALAMCVALPIGWYAKNQVQYGFFGGSSWYGMGLWRVALFRQDPAVLEALRSVGALDPVVDLAPFSPPSSYRPLGFDAESRVPLLSRDDLHNVNIPAVSAAYQRSARALIRTTPRTYLSNVLTAYGNFSAPSTEFDHLEPNRLRIATRARLYSWATGRPVAAALERRFGGYYGSFYFVLIPAALLGYALTAWRRVRAPGAERRAVRVEAGPAFIALLIAYTTVTGSAMELGENVRFKFGIEPILLVLCAVVASRIRDGSTGAAPRIRA